MKNLQSLLLSKGAKTVLKITLFLTLAICIVMNTFLIPAIEGESGLKCFDMCTFGYSVDYVTKFLGSLSADARNLYLQVQLPLDFLYPLVYTATFVIFITRGFGKLTVASALPLVLMVCDYAENVCSIIFLKSTTLPSALVPVASVFTTCKSLLMYAVFAVVIASFVVWVVRKAKKD